MGRNVGFGRNVDFLSDLFEDAHDFLGDPGQFEKEHVVDGDAEGPYVSLEGILLLSQDLRGHELDGA